MKTTLLPLSRGSFNVNLIILTQCKHSNFQTLPTVNTNRATPQKVKITPLEDWSYFNPSLGINLGVEI